MSLTELFGALNGYQSATLTLWNLYVVVVFGSLGYALGMKQALRWSARFVLVLAFSIFAFGNLSFLERNQQIIHAISAEIATKSAAEAKKPLPPTLKAVLSSWAENQPSSIRHIHIPVDTLMVLFLLIGPELEAKLRSREAKKDKYNPA